MSNDIFCESIIYDIDIKKMLYTWIVITDIKIITKPAFGIVISLQIIKTNKE